MWTWLKNLLGIGYKKDVFLHPVVVIENKDEIVNTVVITEQVIETAVTAINLSSMKKEELLSLAKEKGLKANASMNKQTLIDLLNG